MRYHDYRLRSYTVGEMGSEITFDLVFDYPGRPFDRSEIVFSDVRVHHFYHLGGAIITDLEQVPIREALKQHGLVLSDLDYRYGGLPYHEHEEESLCAAIEGEGYKTWLIGSAIGFSGFVVCRQVQGSDTVGETTDRSRDA